MKQSSNASKKPKASKQNKNSSKTKPASAKSSAASKKSVKSESLATAPVNTQPAAPPTSSKTRAKRQTKRGLVVAIVIAVVILLVAAASTVAYALYQKPENVLLDAISKLPLATKASTKTTVTSDFLYEYDTVNVKFKKFTLDTGADTSPKFSANAELSIEVNGREISLKASGLTTDDGTIYFKVDNVVSVIKKALSLAGQKLPSQAEKYLEKIDGKWAKYSLSDMRKRDQKSAGQLQCVLDTYKKYSKDDNAKREIANTYKKYPFVVINKEVKSQDGNFGYDVSIDDGKFETFVKDAKETSFVKQLKSCAPDSLSHSSSKAHKAAKQTKSKADATMTVWVSQWSHELRGVDVSLRNLGTNGRTGKSYGVTAKTAIDFSKGAQVSVPSDAISVEEWTGAVQRAFQVAGGAYSTPSVSSSYSGGSYDY